MFVLVMIPRRRPCPYSSSVSFRPALGQSSGTVRKMEDLEELVGEFQAGAERRGLRRFWSFMIGKRRCGMRIVSIRITTRTFINDLLFAYRRPA